MPATSAYASWFRYAEARPPASTLRSLLLPQAAWALSSSKVGPNPADSGGGRSLPRRNGGNATRVALLVVAGFLSGVAVTYAVGRYYARVTKPRRSPSHTGCAGAQRSGRSQRGRASRREGVRGATRFLQESSDGAFAGDDSDFCVSGPTAQRSPSSSASESDGCFWDGLPAGATPRPRLSANQTHATTLIHNSENVRLLNALWMVAGDQARKVPIRSGFRLTRRVAEGYVHPRAQSRGHGTNARTGEHNRGTRRETTMMCDQYRPVPLGRLFEEAWTTTSASRARR
ncbi:MAG: hypothetical protein BJ554DRAFT_2876 [Olpidium bornovanus]|uniref:Uncharacterized protein n=1 Tax=Olpidium bornovanus TaxID=278681 RepID=A0A8H8DGA4_9FUNG|nr:MAG: hypothetical protein BJ554DRAFT_2876 [Olpidium bornovanus]